MQIKNDGQNYAPIGNANIVCKKGMFKVGVCGLDHGHIFGMCNGLKEAGADIYKVYDNNSDKSSDFCRRYSLCKKCNSFNEILEDPEIKLVAIASIPGDRAKVALKCLEYGKHVFIDKPAMVTLNEINLLKKAVKKYKKRLFVYFSERLHVEAAVCAEELIKQGVIGKVVSVQGFGPHRLSEKSRPEWFFDDKRFGGIITDIGCHQIEQILFFAGASDGKIISSRIGNFAHKQYLHFQDYGDVTFECSNNVAGYFRVDWFTPDGLNSWGDGRTFIVGERGFIELRKYINIAESKEGDHVYYVNETGEHHIEASGKYGFPFFGRMIRDILDSTDKAMSQDYIFRVMELAITAQKNALKIGGNLDA